MTARDPRFEFTTYDRVAHGESVVSWIYQYWNPMRIAHSGLSAGLEIGVQLEGEWLQTARFSGTQLFEAGTIHRLGLSESFEISFASRHGVGTQVGFIVNPKDVPEYQGLDGELRFCGDAGMRDPAFLEFCRWFYSRRGEVSTAVVQSALRSYIGRHCDLVKLDPVLVAKRELEMHFNRELLIEHIADAASLHPVTFARNFKKRFGMTPAHYRLQYRLNQASYLIWSEPSRSIEAIAHDSGFNDMAYFHRAYLKHFGATPADHCRRRRADFERLGF